MGNFSQSSGEQRSESNSGLLAAERAQFSPFAAKFATDLGTQLLDLTTRPVPTSSFDLGPYGLASNFGDIARQLGADAFSRASAAGAARGFLSPESFAGVAGSAITNALPQLAPFALPSLQNSIFGPQQFEQQKFAPAIQFANLFPGLLGNSFQGTGSQSAFGFGVNGTFPGLGGGGGGAELPKNCWIAMALYGDHDRRVHSIRAYLARQAEKNWQAKIGVWVYGQVGEHVAAFLRRHAWAKPPFRLWFDRLLKRADEGVHAQASK